MLNFSVPKAEVDCINYHIEAVAQADKDSNNLACRMDNMMGENPTLDPIVDAMLALDNDDRLMSDLLITSIESN